MLHQGWGRLRIYDILPVTQSEANSSIDNMYIYIAHIYIYTYSATGPNSNHEGHSSESFDLNIEDSHFAVEPSHVKRLLIDVVEGPPFWISVSGQPHVPETELLRGSQTNHVGNMPTCLNHFKG